VRLQNLDDTRDKLRQLTHGWDNRLVLEREPFVEAYIKGRTSILVIVQKRDRAGTRYSEAFRSGVILDEDQALASPFRKVIIVARHNDGEGSTPGMSEQEPVFVHAVKLVELNKWVPITIRLYVVKDQISNVGSDALYYSKMFLTYQRCGSHIDRKIQIGRRLLEGTDDGICEMIECAPQIVDCVTSGHLQDGEAGKERFPVHRYPDAPLSVRIILDDDSVHASLINGAERFFEISDVLIGPFDLSCRAFLVTGCPP
jgi:hypothetical protein